jgi:hypothetical protein
MLLTVEGYFEAGRFIADTPIQIPERRKTIITVLDEKVDKKNEQERYRAYWNKIIADIQNSGIISCFLKNDPAIVQKIT